MELRILSPTAILGYGYPVEAFKNIVREGVDVIAVDAGSTDPGPYYLGSGKPFTSRDAVKRDLRHMIQAVREYGVPLIIGSAGGAGAKPHVDLTLDIIRELAGELGVKLRVGIIYSDIDRRGLLESLNERTHEPLTTYFEAPLPQRLESSERVVAQVGIEPIIKLLEEDVEVIVAGRTVDTAPFAAVPWMKGYPKGLSVHLAKILECGALAAEPGSGSDGMVGVIRSSEFEVYPVNPSRRATLISVSEHALYERSDPYKEYLPGGYADLSRTVYEEVDGKVVVRGTEWVTVTPRLVKLEGVRWVGHRYIVIGGARDPRFIQRLDTVMQEAIHNVENLVGLGDCRVYYRVYGRNGVMGAREPTSTPAHEVGILIETVCSSREKAKSVASLIRSTILHYGWPGRKTTAGNVAFPFSPSDFYGGEVYEWSVWDLVEERDPLEFSKLEVLEVSG